MRGSLLAAAAALLLQLPLVDGGFRGSFRAAAWAARSEARQLNTSGPSSAGRRVGPVPDASQSWWLNGAPLQNVSGPLPADADIVIIGAGITVRQRCSARRLSLSPDACLSPLSVAALLRRRRLWLRDRPAQAAPAPPDASVSPSPFCSGAA